MMTLTAKYAGRCTRCNRPINVGDRIAWEPGATSEHVDCDAVSDRATFVPEPKRDAFDTSVSIRNGLYRLGASDEPGVVVEIRDGFEDDDGRHIVAVENVASANGTRNGFGHVEPDGTFRVWRRSRGVFGETFDVARLAVRQLLAADDARLRSWAKRYADATGRCYRCGRVFVRRPGNG